MSTTVLQNDNGASQANGVGAAAATILDNRFGGNVGQSGMFDFELKTANPGWGSAPAAGVTLDLYAVPSISAFGSVASSIPQSDYYVGSFQVALTTNNTVEVMNVLGVPLNWLQYKIYLVNNSAVTLNANWGLRVTPSGGPFN